MDGDVRIVYENVDHYGDGGYRNYTGLERVPASFWHREDPVWRPVNQGYNPIRWSYMAFTRDGVVGCGTDQGGWPVGAGRTIRGEPDVPGGTCVYNVQNPGGYQTRYFARVDPSKPTDYDLSASDANVPEKQCKDVSVSNSAACSFALAYDPVYVRNSVVDSSRMQAPFTFRGIYLSESDCNANLDAPAQNGWTLDLPVNDCLGSLSPATGDVVDSYGVDGQTGLTLRVTLIALEGATLNLCIQAPSSSVDRACAPLDGTATRALQLRLDQTGRWGLRIDSVSGTGSYALSVSVIDESPQDDCGTHRDAGQSYDDATIVASTVSGCTGSLRTGDWRDWYQFFVPNGQPINAQVDSESGNGAICLYGPDSSVARSCSEAGFQEAVQLTADRSGGWRIRVTGSNGDYALHINAGTPAAAPTLHASSCLPNPVLPGTAVTCGLAAQSGTEDVYYDIAWGDESSNRVPPTGYVPRGERPSISHAWPAQGDYHVVTSVTDAWGTRSPLETHTVFVHPQAVQDVPVVDGLACGPNPSAPGMDVTCRFRAVDDADRVFFTVSWGDGSPLQRVPTTGDVAPGTWVEAKHPWQATGSYVIGVRSGDPASGKAGFVEQRTQSVENIPPPNQRPTLGARGCGSGAIKEDVAVLCSFDARDDSEGVYFIVDWGDGSGLQRLPASGTVPPGATIQVDHAFLIEGATTVTVQVYDSASPSLRSDAGSFVVRVDPANAAPVLQDFTCSPTPAHATVEAMCLFHALDDGPELHYLVTWADGTTPTRVPPQGSASSGAQMSVAHTWEDEGSYRATVVAVDHASPPKTSTTRTFTVEVERTNRRPTLPVLGCDPSPSRIGETVTCTFQAADDSDEVRYVVNWGDGSLADTVPPQGSVAPGMRQSANHTYGRLGDFPITLQATDLEGAESRTSLPRAASHQVVLEQTPNRKPVLGAFHCAPAPARTGETVTCEFFADDDSTNVSYMIDWNDGSALTRIPSVGTAAPGELQWAVHAWPAPGQFQPFITATDAAPDPLSSEPRFVPLNVVPRNERPRIEAFACESAEVRMGAVAPCSVAAADDSAGIAYRIDWGDVSPVERYPRTGFQPAGSGWTPSHKWAVAGRYTVTATAVDDDGYQLTSTPTTIFVDVVRVNARPVLQRAVCSPQAVLPNAATTCYFHAMDDSTGVAYRIDWGDGTPMQRVPASGYLDAGAPTSATYAWAAEGSYRVTVYAEDNDAVPLEGVSESFLVTVTPSPPANQAPLLLGLSCSATVAVEYAPVSCSPVAQDDSTGVYYVIDWGDGSQTRVPTWGYSAPGVTRMAMHAYDLARSYAVTAVAFDNDSAPRVSAPSRASFAIEPRPFNDVPAISSFECAEWGRAGSPLGCEFVAGDDSTGVYYLIDWGDSSQDTRVPAVGFAQPGYPLRAVHLYDIYSTTWFMVTVHAVDDGDPAMPSAPKFDMVGVKPAQPCVLFRNEGAESFVVMGLNGEDVEGVSGRTEGDIRESCWDRTFILTSSTPLSDFNLCWHGKQDEVLACHNEPGPDEGTIPQGAMYARIVYATGAVGRYTLAVTASS